MCQSRQFYSFGFKKPEAQRVLVISDTQEKFKHKNVLKTSSDPVDRAVQW